MPTHVYKPIRNPPHWWERVLIHPFENVFGAGSAFFALIVTAALLCESFIPSVSMDKMPLAVAILAATLSGAGGLLALVGLHWTGDSVSKGWILERSGWLAVIGGLATFAISVAWHYPGSVFSWGFPAVGAAGALLRFFSILMIERDTRRTLMVVQGVRG